MKLLKVPATLEGIKKRLSAIESAIRELQRRAFLTPPQERLARELKRLRLVLKDRELELAPALVPV